MLQAGDAASALELARRVAAAQPANARARLAMGIALRMLGQLDEAAAELERAASLDPRDHAPPYERGVVRQLQGRDEDALGDFDRSARLRPDFFAAHFSAALLRIGRQEWEAAITSFRAALAIHPSQVDALLHLAWALHRNARHDEAEQAYVRALAANPHHFPTLRAFAGYCAVRGNFTRAAKLFTEAARQAPEDEALPTFIAQSELLLGNWDAAWAAYRRREPRRQHERALAARGHTYRVPTLAEAAGRDVTLVAEQGLGDTLFFLRWAPLLRDAGAHLHFAGHPRLHSLLGRTGLFESFHAAAGDAAALLIGDLPPLFPSVDPLEVASLRFAPLPEKVSAWRAALEAAGPHPWIGVTWRAGTPSHVVAHALHKAVAHERLMAALAPLGGTVVALQRAIEPGELEAASRALGREVHDFSRINDDLEDALALLTLLDRHVGVSNTNVHLAAAAGATGDVLVPFPPEWRWRLEGDSPWFPGFRVHRQSLDGDWAEALTAIGGAGSYAGAKVRQ